MEEEQGCLCGLSCAGGFEEGGGSPSASMEGVSYVAVGLWCKRSADCTLVSRQDIQDLTY